MDEQIRQPNGENVNPLARGSSQSPINPLAKEIGRQKAPIPVRILAILMMLGGMASMAYFIFFLAEAITGSLNFPWLISIGLFIFSAILITAAWGLRDMKKWGLYFAVSWSIIPILFSVYNLAIKRNVSLSYGSVFILVNVLVAGYLVYIRNKFEPEKPHQPVLIAAMAATVLVLSVISFILTSQLDKTEEKYLQTQKTAEVQPSAEWDQTINSNVSMIGIELDIYFLNHNTYIGFSAQSTDVAYKAKDINEPGCKTSMKIDISPDGQKFVVYEPLCSDLQKSACYENGMDDAIVAETTSIEKSYSCK